MATRLFTLGLAVVLLVPHPCTAQGKVKLAREVAKYIMQKFGKEAARDGIETLTRKVEALAIKHGDEALMAVRKVGPRTFRLVEEAGEHGLQSIKLMAKYGDEAVWVVAKPNRMAFFVKFGDNAAEAMINHGEIAEPLLRSIGKPAAGALKAVSSQNGRRLAMLAEDGQLTKIGRTPELLDVITKYGDRAMNFVWRNKGALMVSAALTAFLSNPEPFINGAADITKVVAENTVRPIASMPGQVVSEAAKRTNWTVVIVSTLCTIALLTVIRMWIKHRRIRAVPHVKQAAKPNSALGRGRHTDFPEFDAQPDGHFG